MRLQGEIRSVAVGPKHFEVVEKREVLEVGGRFHIALSGKYENLDC